MPCVTAKYPNGCQSLPKPCRRGSSECDSQPPRPRRLPEAEIERDVPGGRMARVDAARRNRATWATYPPACTANAARMSGTATTARQAAGRRGRRCRSSRRRAAARRSGRWSGTPSRWLRRSRGIGMVKQIVVEDAERSWRRRRPSRQNEHERPAAARRVDSGVRAAAPSRRTDDSRRTPGCRCRGSSRPS